MSDLNVHQPLISKKRLLQLLDQLEKNINNLYPKNLDLMDQLNLYRLLIERQTKLCEELTKETVYCVQLERKCLKLVRRKCSLERYQQFREELEWWQKLKQQYERILKIELKYQQELLQKVMHCRQMDRQLRFLHEKEEKQRKKIYVIAKGLKKQQKTECRKASKL